MNYVTETGLMNAFQEVGIEKGDTILIHSDITSFGLVEKFTKQKQLDTFYNAIMNTIGQNGTLCVPAFFYEYARYGTPFDIQTSPVSDSLGVFSQYINSIKDRKRSCCPTTSIAALGKNADYICEILNRHGYGEDSAWHRMHKLNTKIVMLGTFHGLTFTHYVDYRVGVPYLYTKLYNIPVYNNGVKIFDNTFASVRYLKYDINWLVGQEKFNLDEMLSKGIMKHCKYNNGDITVSPMQPLFDYCKNKLYENPYHFLANEPNFIPGEIPNDSLY